METRDHRPGSARECHGHRPRGAGRSRRVRRRRVAEGDPCGTGGGAIAVRRRACRADRREEEAIAIASDTDYGLSSSVWTADPARGAELGKNLRVGSLYVNGAFKLDPNVPFGGFKQAGVGRELGPEGLAEYQETQAVFCP
jgi:hypothetical protein